MLNNKQHKYFKIKILYRKGYKKQYIHDKEKTAASFSFIFFIGKK